MLGTEVSRKFVHLFALIIPILYYFLPQGLSIIILLIATVVFLTVDFLRLHLNPFKDIFIILFGSLLRRREFSSLTGGSYLLLAALFAIFVFNDRGVFIAAITFLVIGDTVAAIIGLSIGRIKVFRKSLEGALAGFLSCLGIAYLVSKLPGIDLPFSVGILGALVAALVEILPIEVNDNVVIPLLSGAVMSLTKAFL